MGRQLAVVERTDLSFYKGWDGCYVDWHPATYGQAMSLIRSANKDMTEEAATTQVVETVKERLVGGKVRVLKDGKGELVDIEAEDIDSMPSTMVDRIFADMTGVKYDPDPLEPTVKETESLTDTGSTKPQIPTSTTETQ